MHSSSLFTTLKAAAYKHLDMYTLKIKTTNNYYVSCSHIESSTFTLNIMQHQINNSKYFTTTTAMPDTNAKKCNLIVPLSPWFASWHRLRTVDVFSYKEQWLQGHICHYANNQNTSDIQH